MPIPIGALVRSSSFASGSSHCVVEILNNILDEIFSEFEVTEVVERGEELEMLHEPGLSRKQLLNAGLHEADPLDPFLCLAKCPEHFQIPIRKSVFHALLREDRIIRSHVVPLSRERQCALSK